MYNLNIKCNKSVIKYLNTLDTNIYERIIEKILKLPAGDVVQMKGYPELYRLRIGKYRIIFTYKNQNEIIVVDIGTRGDIYK